MDITENSPPKPLPCDLNRVDSTLWSQRAFPMPRITDVGIPVVVRQSVLNAIHQHGQSAIEVEICGVLVGNGYRDECGPFVYIEASIRGEHAGSQLAQVTFTAETWNHIQEVLDRDHPHLRIMGWYHTHPGFGIFLSPMDMFIHENFFNSAEQLALVYDPVRGQEGVFIWREGEAKREGVLVEPDVAEENEKMVIRISSLPPATAAADADNSTLATQLAELNRRQRLLTAAMGLLALVAILWPIGLQVMWPRLIARPPSATSDGDQLTISLPNNDRAGTTDDQPSIVNPPASSVPGPQKSDENSTQAPTAIRPIPTGETTSDSPES